jgi:hypothetical protein
MAIKHFETVFCKEKECYVRTDKEPKLTYVGRVLKVFRRDLRVMSDIYSYATYALVVEENGAISDILVNSNFELDSGGGFAEEDADEWALARKAEHDQRIADIEKQRWEEECKRRNEAEVNQPVRGKLMVVAKAPRGQKQLLGLKGIVAYVSGSGGVLLKDPSVWQDRKADGVWVPKTCLKAA